MEVRLTRVFLNKYTELSVVVYIHKQTHYTFSSCLLVNEAQTMLQLKPPHSLQCLLHTASAIGVPHGRPICLQLFTYSKLCLQSNAASDLAHQTNNQRPI